MKKFLSIIVGGATIAMFVPFAFADTLPTGTITSPSASEVTHGTVNLSATYTDSVADDTDPVYWAVRAGTCAAATGTVFGNVDGHSDAYDWNNVDFSATIDVSALTPGEYCFVFNPQDDPGEQDVRETQMFYVVQDYVDGGGRILEQIGSKRKDWNDISFGGLIGNAGTAGLVGDWEVNLHNVKGTDLDKSKFHTTSITALNFYPPSSGTCTAALNFTAAGRFNGVDGYTMVFRAGDNDDTIRLTISGPGGVIYDSDTSGDFTRESSCVGSARTGVDNGNITINY